MFDLLMCCFVKIFITLAYSHISLTDIMLDDSVYVCVCVHMRV